MNLICDVKSMEEAVVEMKYDAKKAPLGNYKHRVKGQRAEALVNVNTLVNFFDLNLFYSGIKYTEKNWVRLKV